MILNKDLRIKIVKMITKAGEGHIPSSFSILDIVHFLYNNIIKYKSNNPKWEKRDYFVLSKGHGAPALYVVLNKFKILNICNEIIYVCELIGKPNLIKTFENIESIILRDIVSFDSIYLLNS